MSSPKDETNLILIIVGSIVGGTALTVGCVN